MNLKVIALPFAGGNKYCFNFLQKILESKQINFINLEYPGRGRRMGEPALDVIEDVVEDILRQLPEKVGHDDYLIYGHSMGGLAAYLLCKEIEQRSLKKPLQLIVSGASPPSDRAIEKTHHLGSEAFWGKVIELGGIPDELLKEETLKNIFEKILRADFKAIEEYRYTGKANLTIPIEVLYGSKEKKKDIVNIEKWRDETTGQVRITRLEGDHFFIYDHAEYLAKRILYALHYASSP